LFTSRCDYFDESKFFRGLFSDPYLEVTLKAFDDIVHQLVSQRNINAFQDSPACTAMRMLHKSRPELRNGWKAQIHRLLTLGPELHAWPMIEGGTMLDQIVDIPESPFDSLEVGEEWLTLLESSGVDIGDYLRTEHILQSSYEHGSIPMLSEHVGADARPRHLVFSEDIPRASWDWYIDPHGHACEALYEFRNLGPPSHDPKQDYKCPDEMSNWPFIYPRWQSCASMPYRCSAKETKRTLIKLFESRSESRWLKKMKKLERFEGIRKIRKVPGAWID
jgi:hypothetical protein